MKRCTGGISEVVVLLSVSHPGFVCEKGRPWHAVPSGYAE
jgi:hypothetical protein